MLSIALLLALQPVPPAVPPAAVAPRSVEPAPTPPRPGPWIRSEPPPEPGLPLGAVDGERGEPVVEAPLAAPLMTLEVERDLITDHLRAFAVARTSGARLEIGCDHRRRDGVIVRFSGRHWLERGNAFTGERPFRHRFDLGPPLRAYWRIRDREATLHERDDVAPFIAWARGSERLVIRAIDVEGREIDLVFPLLGADAAVGEVLALCADERLAAEMVRRRPRLHLPW